MGYAMEFINALGHVSDVPNIKYKTVQERNLKDGKILKRDVIKRKILIGI
jgi:hypothetical protein